METKASYVLVGSFVLGFLVAMVAAIIWISGSELDEDFSYYDILFDGSVTGLKDGNPVRYRGVPVGVVTDIRINEENVEQVRVTIEIQSSTPIKEDAEASLEFQGLTGVGYVQISGGTHQAKKLEAKSGERYPVIPSRPSQLQAVFDQAPELINRFIALVDRANLLLNPANQENIAGTLNNLNSFSGALADGSGDLKTIMKEAADTLERLKTASASADQLIQSFAKRSESLADNLDATLLEGRDLVSEARTMTSEVTEAVRLARPVLETADSAMSDFSELTAELKPEVGPTAKKARVTMDQLAEVATELRKAATTMGSAAESIAKAADEAGGMLAENREPVNHFAHSGLYEFTQLMSETRLLVNNLTRLASEIERDPARFFFGDSQKGFDAQ